MNAAAKLTPKICGRGAHLLRSAILDGQVVIDTAADAAAFRPVVINGYARKRAPGVFIATEAGRDYLVKLARVW